MCSETNESKPVVTEGGLAEDVAKLSVSEDKPLSESWLDQMTFHVGKIKLTATSDFLIFTDLVSISSTKF